jgi:hypothetical protein
MRIDLPVLLALCLGLVPLSAHAAGVDAKPGLWETTTVMQHGDAGKKPDLATLPPEQRAQLQPMLDRVSGKPVTDRECIRSKTLESWQDVVKESQSDSSCRYEIVESSPKQVRMKVSCEGGATTGTMHWTVPTPDRMEARIEMVSRGEGDERKTTVTTSSRWLGADCGDVAPE